MPHSLPTATVIEGDALVRLAELPDRSVRCVVTSPPYWGLRDYGHDRQLGLEPTPQEFVANMVKVFIEVKRVLADDGTLWLNVGDSYLGSGKGGQSAEKRSENWQPVYAHNQRADIAPKNLVGIPWRLAFALQDDGWILRSDIIWAKPNPMPESVTDRPTKSHEHLFLFAKSPRYFYDAAAIAEPIAASSEVRLAQNLENQLGSDRVPGKTNGTMKVVQSHALATDRRDNPGGGYGWKGSTFTNGKTAEHQLGRSQSELSRSERLQPRFGGNKYPGRDGFETYGGGRYEPTGMRNKRDVWTISTQPFSQAHFATFPEALVEPCILAGSEEGDVVLDPFAGSGTTGVVALRHQRNFVGIELNPEYAEMARNRIRDDAPLLNQQVS